MPLPNFYYSIFHVRKINYLFCGKKSCNNSLSWSEDISTRSHMHVVQAGLNCRDWFTPFLPAHLRVEVSPPTSSVGFWIYSGDNGGYNRGSMRLAQPHGAGAGAGAGGNSDGDKSFRGCSI